MTAHGTKGVYAAAVDRQ